MLKLHAVRAIAALTLALTLAPAARADDDVKSLKQAQAEAKKKKKKAAAADAAPAEPQYPGLPPLPAGSDSSSAATSDTAPARTGVIIPGQMAPAPDPDVVPLSTPQPAAVAPAREVVAPQPAYQPPPPEPVAQPSYQPPPPEPAYQPPPQPVAQPVQPSYQPPPPEPSPAPSYAPPAQTFAPAPSAFAGPASAKDVEQIIAQAAQAEKAQQCEVAYAGYQSALERAGRVPDKARAGELESIAQNKIDKLEDCYRACQPNARQRSLFESAQGAKERGESKRATQIARKLLTGKDKTCVFWGQVHELLSSMPGEADELANDKFDPCEVTPEVQKELDTARSTAKREQQELGDLMANRSRLSGHMDQMVSLWRELDQTRQRIFEMREEFLDCDAVYKPLVEDAANLHDTFEKSESLILSAYRGQLDSLSKKVRAAQGQLDEKSRLLETRGQELDRLKKQLDDMGTINEDIYNDLFDLAGTESINFTTQIEGRRIEKPMEEIRALMSDESKVISTLQSKYPEYFANGVNVEAMKRKKLVLEKIEQMMQKFQKAHGDTHPAGQRSIDELDATIKMLDKAIGSKAGQADASGEKKEESSGGVPTWLIVLGGLLAVGGFLYWRMKGAGSNERRGIR